MKVITSSMTMMTGPSSVTDCSSVCRALKLLDWTKASLLEECRAMMCSVDFEYKATIYWVMDSWLKRTSLELFHR